MLLRRDERHSEAKVCIGEERACGKEKTPGRPAVRVEVVVSAAAHYFQSKWIGSGSGRIGLNSARQGAKPILAPFPDVSFHVVQSPWIGELLPDGVHREAGVVRVPCVIRQAGVARILSVTEPRRSAGARGAFPLRPRWQTILAAGGNTARR